jgi:DNA-binding NtrC family response regulator
MAASRVTRSDDARPFGAPGLDGIVGESESAHRLRDAIAFAAQASGHVLLTGESGTGKELTARAVHAQSGRAKGSFVSRNAATLPAGIVDAELFGNARNYPNAGVPERAGLVGEAHGGVLFLDEIGELPTELQAHLLRFLDAGEYHRLGEATARRSDVRVVGATNRDPALLKHDLLARFTLRIATPPLSERREDIPLLARHMLDAMAARAPALFSRFRDDAGHIRLARGFVERLVRATWQGNIRELEAALWAGVEESPRDRIDRSSRVATPTKVAQVVDPSTPPADRPGRTDDPTAEEIRKAVRSAQGNLTIAARALGTNRFALYRLLRRYGIDADTLRSTP